MLFFSFSLPFFFQINIFPHFIYSHFHNPFLKVITPPLQRLTNRSTGKTFVLNILLDTVRERGQIAIAVASSGVAALILHGGRTAHSRFKIPIDNMNATSTCAIAAQSGLARLIMRTSLIIWDEASMLSKHQISCVDRTIRDLMPLGSAKSKQPFGGIIVVFSGRSAGRLCGNMHCAFRRLPASVASCSARRKSESSRTNNETMV